MSDVLEILEFTLYLAASSVLFLISLAISLFVVISTFIVLFRYFMLSIAFVIEKTYGKNMSYEDSEQEKEFAVDEQKNNTSCRSTN